jgi:hypothetical protein
MADGLVAGKAQASDDVLGGTNEAFFSGGLQEELREVARDFRCDLPV